MVHHPQIVQVLKSQFQVMHYLVAGSTFVYPLFSKMFSEYNKIAGIEINYQSIGSGGGILQITNKTVDFGGSDAPLNDEQTKKLELTCFIFPLRLVLMW